VEYFVSRTKTAALQTTPYELKAKTFTSFIAAETFKREELKDLDWPFYIVSRNPVPVDIHFS